MTREWEYLGDGVYSMVDEHDSVVVHVGAHDRPTDRVVLEPEVLRRLVEQAKRAGVLS
jgi:hypothetical protein